MPTAMGGTSPSKSSVAKASGLVMREGGAHVRDDNVSAGNGNVVGSIPASIVFSCPRYLLRAHPANVESRGKIGSQFKRGNVKGDRGTIAGRKRLLVWVMGLVVISPVNLQSAESRGGTNGSSRANARTRGRRERRKRQQRAKQEEQMNRRRLF